MRAMERGGGREHHCIQVAVAHIIGPPVRQIGDKDGKKRNHSCGTTRVNPSYVMFRWTDEDSEEMRRLRKDNQLEKKH